MYRKRWSGITLVIFLSIYLYGCLIGKTPAVQTSPQAQAPTQNKKIYLPVISQPPPPSVPLVSNSMYITTLDSNILFNQGCVLGSRDLSLAGKQDSVVVLHFGYPRMVNNQYGARLYYPAAPATVDQIATAVQQFGYGYWYCVGADFDSHLRIGIGTSNYGGSIYSLVTAGHGQAWARMVNRVNDWFQNVCDRGCDGQVDAVGANDLELSWNDYEHSLDWLLGYDSANNAPMYNFGAIPGCPYFASPGAQCGGAGYLWSKEQVWMVTYGLSPVYPLPEIYRTDGVNAQQWYLMSVYSYTNHGVKMQFIGPMSQYQACLQRGGCSMINNTAEQAWKQLYNLLNGDARTDGEALPYVTDIFWLNEPFSVIASVHPEQPTEVPAAPQNTYFVEELQTALQSDRLSAQARQSLEEKLLLSQQLAGSSVPQAANPGPKTRAQSLLPAMESGTGFTTEEEILQGSEGVVRTWEADIQNLWEGQRDGVYYQVLAGAATDDPEQSLLLVIDTRPETNERNQQYYYPAEKAGKLRIVQVQGTRVILATAKGGQITFDLSTRSFQ